MTERYLKVADKADAEAITHLVGMALKDSQYKDKELDTPLVLLQVTEMVNNPADNLCLLLLNEDNRAVGVLLAIINPLSGFVASNLASELLWWVHPDHRNSDSAPKMINAYEYWAKERGCASLTMVSMENECTRGLDVLYRRKGFKKAETTYLKELI